MAIIPGGVQVGGFISPTDSLDIYPTHKPEYGFGGYGSVADTTERDAISVLRREEGMMRYKKDDDKFYYLKDGITNDKWTEFTGGAETDPVFSAWVSGFSEVVDDRINALLQEGAGIDLTYDDTANTLTIASTITQFTNEMVDDRVASLIQNGTGISWTYDDTANTLTGNVSITQYTDELAQDAIGGILTDTNTIDFTYNDSSNLITADVKLNSSDTQILYNDGGSTIGGDSKFVFIETTDYLGIGESSPDTAVHLTNSHPVITLENNWADAPGATTFYGLTYIPYGALSSTNPKWNLGHQIVVDGMGLMSNYFILQMNDGSADHNILTIDPTGYMDYKYNVRVTGTLEVLQTFTTIRSTLLNSGGGDYNFQVEGQTEPYALGVDASTETAYAQRMVIGDATSTQTDPGDNNLKVIGNIATNGSMIAQGGGAFNDGGGDNDVYIEGVTATKLLYIDTGLDAVQIGTTTAGVIADFRAATIVFNEASADIDFRVESNTYANMFMVDGGGDKVDIGSATQGAIASFSNTGVIFNEDSQDRDFRVESGGDANALFVNGGEDSVAMGAVSSVSAGRTWKCLVKAADSVLGLEETTTNLAKVILGLKFSADSTILNTDRFISFNDSGGEVGWIDQEVAYNNFTGGHTGQTEEDFTKWEQGMILSVTGKISEIETEKVSIGRALSEVRLSNGRKDKAVIGVYTGSRKGQDQLNKGQDPGHNIKGFDRNRESISYNAVGEGLILVNGEGGDIEMGDYIYTSSVRGIGMKQDDDLLHNYTVAKATQSVIWKEEKDTQKLIACTYHGG